ncbi:MAG: hypothetical protein NTV88_04165 [Candidatus Micrarchaeota archaeon]|nr:hypothetical protein [Candidatus Micrarchaeota archaeon]
MIDGGIDMNKTLGAPNNQPAANASASQAQQAQPTPKQTYACPDGTVVTDLANCPKPTKTYSCPDGSVVTDLSSCPKCPASCDDNNTCTADSCGLATNYTCKHDSINNTPCGNNGVCVNSICKESETNTSNTIGEMTQTANETVCVLNDGICEQAACNIEASNCINACGADYDCKTSCRLNFTDSADCITKCDAYVKDNVCPTNCNGLTDIDCPLYGASDVGTSKDGKITLQILSVFCSTHVLTYKVCNIGQDPLDISNEMFEYCQYNDVNCYFNTEAYYSKVASGYCYTRTISIDPCTSAGRFAFDPGYPAGLVAFKVQSS